VRDRDAAHSYRAHRVAAAEQDVTVVGQARLHDADARLPLVRPEQGAVSRRDARRPTSAQQDDLSDPVDGR
jgi:hypothetical protein